MAFEGDSLLHAGRIAEAVPVLLGSGRTDSPDVMYDLAWAYNRLDMPDSALSWARAAWEAEPQDQWYLSELLKALSRLGLTSDIEALAPFIRGGGSARYHAAAGGHAASEDWLREAALSGDDSTAADALCWLSVLASGRGSPGEALELAREAALRRPSDPFYGSMLVERLASCGRLDEAAEHLCRIRRDGSYGLSYWEAAASVARLEGDQDRLIWALRRALECRTTPSASENLGWALFVSGRRLLSEGGCTLALERIEEAGSLARPGGELALAADSMESVIHEYQETSSGGPR
jgi:tetratricopeptide (TPR) repeat protein